MALNFPTTGLVSNVTTYTDSFNVSWLWNGVSWDIVPNANPTFSSVTSDSLTVNNAASVGTLTALTGPNSLAGGTTITGGAVITGGATTDTLTASSDITTNGHVNVATAPTQTQHATNKKYVDVKSIAMSIALS